MATYHDLNYPIFLDRQLTLTGSYSSPSTTWTIPFVDATVDTIILGAAHGTNAGLILTPDSNVGTEVKATGDYSAGTATVGRMFTMTVELSRPFVRDAQGTADTNDPVNVLAITSYHDSSSSYTVKVTYPNATDRSKEFTPSVPASEGEGSVKAWFQGSASKLKAFLVSTKTNPTRVSSIEWLIHQVQR